MQAPGPPRLPGGGGSQMRCGPLGRAVTPNPPTDTDTLPSEPQTVDNGDFFWMPARQYPDGPESDTGRNEPRDWGGASRRHEAVEHVPVPAAPGSGGGGGGGGGGRVRPLDCGAVDADVPGRVCACVCARGGGCVCVRVCLGGGARQASGSPQPELFGTMFPAAKTV